MPATDEPVVRETPGVCGGYPRVGHTRIPVRLIVELRRAGATGDEILAMYPQLTAAQVQGTLDYYARNPARVDEDIAGNAEAMAALRGRDASRRWSA